MDMHQSIAESGDIVKPSEAESAMTPRELEILRLICEGYSTKEIAANLGISFKTVVSHRTRILRKAGVHDPISLFRWAVGRRLVSLP